METEEDLRLPNRHWKAILTRKGYVSFLFNMIFLIIPTEQWEMKKPISFKISGTLEGGRVGMKGGQE